MTNSPLLDYIIVSITAEELGEVVPAEIQNEVQLYLEKTARGVQ